MSLCRDSKAPGRIGIYVIAFFMLISVFLASTVEADSNAYPFSRVFTTQAERVLLDNNREKLLSGQSLDDVPVSELGDISVDDNAHQEFILSGLLVRGDGKTQVWINGESELTQSGKIHGSLGLKEHALADKTVRLNYRDKYRTMKPGQVWLVDEGQVKELHQREETSKISKSSPQTTLKKPGASVEGSSQAEIKKALEVIEAHRAEQR